MGAECCTASSNEKHDQILAQKTEYTVEDEPNQEAKQQIEIKKNQENTLKTNFYGNAGIVCSKTMTAQKNSKIEGVVQDYKGKILNEDKNLYNIKEDAGEDQLTRKQTTQFKRNQPQISTAQIIDQEANDYLQGMFGKLKEG